MEGENLVDTKNNLVDLLERLFTFLAETGERTHRKDETSQLTDPQKYYLELIDSLDRPTIAELADRLNLTRPTVTVRVRELIELGHLKKVRFDEDKRILWLELTNSGTRVLQKQSELRRNFAVKIAKAIDSKEAQELSRIISKVLRKFD